MGARDTIAAELGDISRFASSEKLCGYTGLCPRVCQSGGMDHRGSLSKNGPEYLRWALIEAATNAARHPAYAEHYQRTARRLGRQRGKKGGRVELARTLAEAIWHVLTTNQPSNRRVRARRWRPQDDCPPALVPAGPSNVPGRVTALNGDGLPARVSHPTWSSPEEAIES
jgi:hypothetical protein